MLTDIQLLYLQLKVTKPEFELPNMVISIITCSYPRSTFHQEFMTSPVFAHCEAVTSLPKVPFIALLGPYWFRLFPNVLI